MENNAASGFFCVAFRQLSAYGVHVSYPIEANHARVPPFTR